MGSLLIISPLFPPMRGGLPDHTDRLSAELARHYDVTVLTSTGVETTRDFRVMPRVRDWRDTGAILAEVRSLSPSASGLVLWQYVPHMYGRGGANLGVGRMMRSLAATGCRQVVLAHEVAAPFSVWPQRFWYATAQRLMWRQVRRHAAAIGISTEGWVESWAGAEHAAGRVFVAPSPSNLPRVAVGADHAVRWRAALGLQRARAVLGFFGSAGAGKQFDWVLEAWRATRQQEPETALVIFGGEGGVNPTGDEAPWFRDLGYLGAPAASEALQALDVLVLPFADGVSERRSSFMAGLAHGCAVLGTVGPATGGALRRSGAFGGVALDRLELRRALMEWVRDPAARRAQAMRGEEWYRSHADWPVLVRALRERLG